MSWIDRIETVPYIDKVVNICMGFFLTLLLTYIFHYEIVLLIITVVALLKEIFDWWMERWMNIDLWDAVCLISGSILYILFLL